MKKSYVVTILNQKLTVRSDASDESVAEIAELVSARVQEVLEKTKSASMLTAVLLTCLNIADELHHLKRLKGTGGMRASQKVREIIQLIDAHLKGDERQMVL